MWNCHGRRRLRVFATVAFVVVVITPFAADRARAKDDGAAPAVGDTAADFELESLRGGTVKLSELIKEGPVVLVVLRGFPGYQCPICSLQVADLRKHAPEIEEAGARVAFVYPGPSDELKERAEEFLGNKALPESFEFLIDPDYKFTNAYHLRWDAPRETAYPSTFVIDGEGTIRYAKISKTHAGRATAQEIIEALP